MNHHLEADPAGFAAVLSGAKTHEVRPADRPFTVGDFLCLHELDRPGGTPTGRSTWVEVTWITRETTYGLGPSTCVLSIRRVDGNLTVRRGRACGQIHETPMD